MKEVKVDDVIVEAVPESCYIGGIISAGGGCEMAVVTSCKCSWASSANCSPSNQPQSDAYDQVSGSLPHA